MSQPHRVHEKRTRRKKYIKRKKLKSKAAAEAAVK
jgi:hypothetical protein